MTYPQGVHRFFRLTMKLGYEKSFFWQGIHIFPKFFFLKYFLVDKLTNGEKKFV